MAILAVLVAIAQAVFGGNMLRWGVSEVLLQVRGPQPDFTIVQALDVGLPIIAAIVTFVLGAWLVWSILMEAWRRWAYTEASAQRPIWEGR